jgi:hypothetical protein
MSAKTIRHQHFTSDPKVAITLRRDEPPKQIAISISPITSDL